MAQREERLDGPAARVEAQPPAATRAIAYLRVSSAGQAKDGRDGLPRQREAVTAWCDASGTQLLEEHVDAGVSGTKALGDRPGLSMALERAVELDAVLVVEKADRLARDLIEGELILREFRRCRVKVIEAEGGTDLTDGDANPTAKLIRQVIGAVAEFEKSALVAKLRAARDRKRRLGGHPCGVYAFGKDPKRPEERATLERARQLRDAGGDGATHAGIAAVLNAEGLRSRSGRPWTHAMVRAVLLA